MGGEGFRERFLNANIHVHFYAPRRGVERRKPLSTTFDLQMASEIQNGKVAVLCAELTYIYKYLMARELW